MVVVETATNPHVSLTFHKVQNPLRMGKTASDRPKVVRTQQRTFFGHLNVEKCPNPSVFFDLEMCFVPQQRALFEHFNFKKWSDVGVFCTF